MFHLLQNDAGMLASTQTPAPAPAPVPVPAPAPAPALTTAMQDTGSDDDDGIMRVGRLNVYLQCRRLASARAVHSFLKCKKCTRFCLKRFSPAAGLSFFWGFAPFYFFLCWGFAPNPAPAAGLRPQFNLSLHPKPRASSQALPERISPPQAKGVWGLPHEAGCIIIYKFEKTNNNRFEKRNTL